MAADHGWKGAVYVGATKIGTINHWQFSPNTQIEETTAFTEEAVSRVFTVKDCGGSFSGNGDFSDSSQNALMTMHLSGGTLASTFLYLYVSGGSGYYGPALVTPGKQQDAKGLSTFDATFVEASAWYTNIA